MLAGYSRTPLTKKLGIKTGFKLYVKNPPANYAELLGLLPEKVKINQRISNGLDMIHFFTKSRYELHLKH